MSMEDPLCAVVTINTSHGVILEKINQHQDMQELIINITSTTVNASILAVCCTAVKGRYKT
jgi:hypothetical protein